MNKEASRIRVSQFLSVIAFAVIGVITFSQDADARWKWGPEGCQWVDEAGGDQCDPNAPQEGQGRYKSDGIRCWWDANDSGPNQCDPNVPPSEAPAVTPETVPEFEIELTPPDEGGGQTGAVAPIPSCRAYTRRGNGGYISVQVEPISGTLAWGAYMNNWTLNYGWWWARVHVNGNPTPEDTKNQPYPPHASLPASKAPAGSTISITVDHLFFTWSIFPVYIPEWGWTYTGFWQPGRAYGSLQCMMPLPGL